VKRNTPGLCNACCETAGGCLDPVQYPAPADWNVAAGGSLVDTADGLEMDGPVHPATFLASEAYTIRFTLEGVAELTIDGDVFTIDAPGQTISINSDSVAIGQAGRAGTRPEVDVELRVTPSHAYLLVYGNYEYPGGPPGANGHAYGLLTVDRSTAVPSSFTIDWTTATVNDFRIDDATVEVTAEGEVTLHCWTQPYPFLPYIYVKKLTRDHLYQDDPVQDRYLPDVAISGWDAIQNPPGPGVGDSVTGYVLACNAPADDPTSLYQTHAVGIPNNAGWIADVHYWIDYQPYGGYGCLSVMPGSLPGFSPRLPYYRTNGNVRLIFDAPTAAEPYPKPYFRAEYGIGYARQIFCGLSGFFAQYTYFDELQSAGFTALDVPANDLKHGFTLAVTTTKQLIFGTVDDFPDSQCQQQYDEVGSITGTWTL
jgi:hypothetical protein